MKERRLHPRFDVILPVQIHKDGGVEEGNIFDISHGGVQIGCEEKVALTLVPGGADVNRSQPVSVALSFRLPGGHEAVEASAGIVVCRRVAADEFRLGLEFVELGTGSQQLLDNYIALRLKGG